MYDDGANLGACSVYMQNVFMYAENSFSGEKERRCVDRLGLPTFPLAAYVKYGFMHNYP